MPSKKLEVYSEVGKLKKVLVHRPGEEIENITPELMTRLLFDDIPFLRVAREEHNYFVKILKENGADPVYLTDLMVDVLKNDEIREQFISQYLDESVIEGDGTYKSVKSYLNEIKDLNLLVSKMISGIYKKELQKAEILSFADIVDELYPFAIDPIPNLYFTRDPAAIVGQGRLVNRMKTQTRRRETMFTDYLFRYHEDFKVSSDKAYYNREDVSSIEGGDVLVLSDKTIAIGISERTEKLAIEKLAKRIFSSSEPFETILAFSLPDKRAFMHLDTVFTMVDKDTFTIHSEIESVLKLYSINKKDGKIVFKDEGSDLKSVLKTYLYLDDVKLIKCGNGDPVTAAREQWNDGSNTLAIAPGELIVYERNYVTNNILEEAGVKLHKMPSSELSRGRGGPRCMSMPLLRESLKN